MRWIAIFLLSTLTGLAQESENTKPDMRVWKISVAAIGGASTLDAASSWGKCCERNALLASDDRRFGARGLAIKSSAMGGQLLLQYLFVRKNPKLARLLGYVNFAGAGAVTGVAIRNYRVPQPR